MEYTEKLFDKGYKDFTDEERNSYNAYVDGLTKGLTMGKISIIDMKPDFL